MGCRRPFVRLGLTGRLLLSLTHYFPISWRNQGELLPESIWWPRRFWFNDLLSLLVDCPGNFITGQIFYFIEADFMRIQTCSTTRLAVIWYPYRRNIFFFLLGLQPSLPLQWESPPEQSTSSLEALLWLVYSRAYWSLNPSARRIRDFSNLSLWW